MVDSDGFRNRWYSLYVRANLGYHRKLVLEEYATANDHGDFEQARQLQMKLHVREEAEGEQ